MQWILACANDNFERMLHAIYAKYFWVIIACIAIPARLQNASDKFRTQTRFGSKTVPAQI